MAALKVYSDRISQPVRAILIFCKVNEIEFEEISIDIFKKEQRKPGFTEINPIKQVPAIVHGDFKLSESHAILIYIATVFPSVADHWYPTDPQKRAKIHSVLDWHHCKLRRGATGYIVHTLLAPVLKIPENPTIIADCEMTLIESLSTIETVWLQENGKFLLGNDQPSIADLSLVCEIMELQMLDENDRTRFLGPYKKIEQWVDDVKNATNPYFEEFHQTVFQFDVSTLIKNLNESNNA